MLITLANGRDYHEPHLGVRPARYSAHEPIARQGFGLAGHLWKSDSQIAVVLADDANSSVFCNESRRALAAGSPTLIGQLVGQRIKALESLDG